jgi:hypothetical protein
MWTFMVVRTEAEFKEKIEYGFELFYKDALEKKDIRHFFFGITLQKIIEDYYLYKDYVMAKPERYYKEMVMQTAPSAVQVKAPQFDEIQISLQNNLRLAGFLKVEIPKLAVHALEVMEETRAQKADADSPKVWKPFEVNNQLVCDYFNANRTDARLEKMVTFIVRADSCIPFGCASCLTPNKLFLSVRRFPPAHLPPWLKYKIYANRSMKG